MLWFAFGYVLVVLSGTEAALLMSMSGGSLLTLLPLWLLVVPALFSGVDLWHLISSKFIPRTKTHSEFAALARFLGCWLVTSVPPTLALMIFTRLTPQVFNNVHSALDCWRVAMSICIWHGFLSLTLITRGEDALCIGYFLKWMKRCLSHRVISRE